LSYLATMPKDITRNRLKSQLISPIKIIINNEISAFYTTIHSCGTVQVYVASEIGKNVTKHR